MPFDLNSPLTRSGHVDRSQQLSQEKVDHATKVTTCGNLSEACNHCGLKSRPSRHQWGPGLFLGKVDSNWYSSSDAQRNSRRNKVDTVTYTMSASNILAILMCEDDIGVSSTRTFLRIQVGITVLRVFIIHLWIATTLRQTKTWTVCCFSEFFI